MSAHSKPLAQRNLFILMGNSVIHLSIQYHDRSAAIPFPLSIQLLHVFTEVTHVRGLHSRLTTLRVCSRCKARRLEFGKKIDREREIECDKNSRKASKWMGGKENTFESDIH